MSRSPDADHDAAQDDGVDLEVSRSTVTAGHARRAARGAASISASVSGAALVTMASTMPWRWSYSRRSSRSDLAAAARSGHAGRAAARGCAGPPVTGRRAPARRPPARRRTRAPGSARTRISSGTASSASTRSRGRRPTSSSVPSRSAMRERGLGVAAGGAPRGVAMRAPSCAPRRPGPGPSTWARNSSTSRRSRVAGHGLAHHLAGGLERQVGDLGTDLAERPQALRVDLR